MKNLPRLAALCLFAVALALQAQFIKWGPDKFVSLAIPRPPDFGLTVKRIAFGQAKGNCASELVDRMILPDFQGNNIDVIERQSLDQIMAEHRFNQSAYADPTQATALGKILGPSALVLVTVDTCSPEQNQLYDDQKLYNGAIHRIFISRTRFSMEGSIRVVDLTTGQVLGSHNFQAKPEKQNTADNGQPEFAPVDEVKDMAMQIVKVQVHNMFFPGTEGARLLFYDDKDCGLKEAYELYQRGDHDGALKLSETDVKECESGHKKDKTLARAYYDAGLANCTAGNYERAKELFSRAMQSKGAEAVAAASADCSRAQTGAAQVATYRERFAQIPAPSRVTEGPQPAPASDGSAAQDPAKPPRHVASPPPSAPSVEERLKRLDELLKKCLITRKDYDTKKADILKDL